ncbi:MAG: hypothetical protein JWO66_1736, partial [Candidatus Eremiobacteraeota bacterium]|nr:hypothetical protein [Candidatus Eremiobacteraeota bacterium]
MTPPALTSSADAVTMAAARSIPNARTESAQPADSFVDSIGVTVHLHYTGTAYVTSYANLETLLVGS